MGIKGIAKKAMEVGEMGFNKEGGVINWFPGHMAAATRAIRNRLKLSDLVIEVRDSRIPFSSAHQDLQPQLSAKRRIIALNKKDLANSNVLNKWVRYFDSCKQDCLPINAHSRSSVRKLLELVEFKLKEVISREPTLLVMVVGVPNVGKSALINSIHQIASTRFPVQEKMKRATVGPLPGVTQDIAGYKIAHQPSIYVLDTPGVLVPSIPNVETGLKLALAGSVKDSVVGEDRIAQYLLAVLNTRGTPLHWKHSNQLQEITNITEYKPDYNPKDLRPKRKKLSSVSDVLYVKDLATEVQHALYVTLSEFSGNIEDENDLECLIEHQFEVLQKALKIPHKSSEARLMVSKKFLTLFRTGKLGSFVLDDVPEFNLVS
ncbi:P-loop containing nucleoside triphosphate hydrolases superfamily protein isoform 1 [Theobroma cacao]|uniref:P-loop containing nucleoside triphosphate hydrolases superfamily protein isoform 1 n=1 Tax=Theobroma cacao TaxID=3641 RepID=A0A061EVU8_THECC|nr:P-loop containing nucleoside triphosphate hydrolases superfamily protein isoform 1 [Theobroma cacao]